MSIEDNTVSINSLIKLLEKNKDKGVVDMVVRHELGGNDIPITQFSIKHIDGKNAILIVKDY